MLHVLLIAFSRVAGAGQILACLAAIVGTSLLPCSVLGSLAAVVGWLGLGSATASSSSASSDCDTVAWLAVASRRTASNTNSAAQLSFQVVRARAVAFVASSSWASCLASFRASHQALAGSELRAESQLRSWASPRPS